MVNLEVGDSQAVTSEGEDPQEFTPVRFTVSGGNACIVIECEQLFMQAVSHQDGVTKAENSIRPESLISEFPDPQTIINGISQAEISSENGNNPLHTIEKDIFQSQVIVGDSCDVNQETDNFGHMVFLQGGNDLCQDNMDYHRG